MACDTFSHDLAHMSLSVFSSSWCHWKAVIYACGSSCASLLYFHYHFVLHYLFFSKLSQIEHFNGCVNIFVVVKPYVPYCPFFIVRCFVIVFSLLYSVVCMSALPVDTAICFKTCCILRNSTTYITFIGVSKISKKHKFYNLQKQPPSSSQTAPLKRNHREK